jgi:hypothetical protein
MMAAEVVDFQSFAAAARAAEDEITSEAPARPKIKPDLKFMLGRIKDMDEEWQEYRPHLMDIARFIMPRRSHYLRSKKKADGGKYNKDIVNTKATRSVRRAVAGFQSGMTPRTRPWFVFQPELAGMEEEVNKFDNTRWANNSRTTVFDVLQRSNFYQSTQICYSDFVPFGIGCIQIDETPGPKVIQTRVHPIGSYLLDVNDEGETDTFARQWNWSLKKIIDKFGHAALPRDLKAQAKASIGTKHKVWNMIYPNKDYQEGKLGLEGKPYLSVWWLAGREDTDPPLRTGGYNEFPIMTPRFWKIGDETWAQAAGMDALPDVKSLQRETSLKMTGIEKQVYPPMKGPASHADAPSQLPGSYESVSDADQVGPLHETNMRLDWVAQDIALLEAAIADTFFEPIFTAIMDSARRQRTLGEVEKIEAEKFMMLGPVLENLIDDLLEPAIERVFAICDRRGLIEEPPSEIAGRPVKIGFVSILAQAQKALEAVGIEQTVGFAANLAEALPEMTDRIDPDEVIERYADATGGTDVLTSRKDAEAIRQQRAVAQQRAQQLAAAEQAAGAAKDAAGAQLSEPSALSALADQFAGGQA